MTVILGGDTTTTAFGTVEATHELPPRPTGNYRPTIFLNGVLHSWSVLNLELFAPTSLWLFCPPLSQRPVRDVPIVIASCHVLGHVELGNWSS
jgi:hypothetical protein